MFENLSSKITSAMRTLKGNGRITDINVAATVKEIRRALMDADVNYKVAKEITDRIKEQALGQKILISVLNAFGMNSMGVLSARESCGQNSL